MMTDEEIEISDRVGKLAKERHWGYIGAYYEGELTLDGRFSPKDLRELADVIEARPCAAGGASEGI